MANREALNANIINKFFKGQTKEIVSFVDERANDIERIITSSTNTDTIDASSKQVIALAEKIMPHIVNCDAMIQYKEGPIKDKGNENRATVANKLASIAKTHAKPAKNLINHNTNIPSSTGKV